MWYLIDVARIDGFSGDGIDGLADVEVRLAARVYAQQLAGTVAEELVKANLLKDKKGSNFDLRVKLRPLFFVNYRLFSNQLQHSHRPDFKIPCRVA